MTGRVASLSASPEYTFTKSATHRVRLIEGIGVEGDIHSGETVKHRSRVRADPTQPNLRQVHLTSRASYSLSSAKRVSTFHPGASARIY